MKILGVFSGEYITSASIQDLFYLEVLFLQAFKNIARVDIRRQSTAESPQRFAQRIHVPLTQSARFSLFIIQIFIFQVNVKLGSWRNKISPLFT